MAATFIYFPGATFQLSVLFENFTRCNMDNEQVRSQRKANKWNWEITTFWKGGSNHIYAGEKILLKSPLVHNCYLFNFWSNFTLNRLNLHLWEDGFQLKLNPKPVFLSCISGSGCMRPGGARSHLSSTSQTLSSILSFHSFQLRTEHPQPAVRVRNYRNITVLQDPSPPPQQRVKHHYHCYYYDYYYFYHI